MWAWVTRIFAVVGAIYTFLDLVALLGIVLLPFSITTSNTLRGFIAGFGILGGVLGYFLTATAWAGKGRSKCLHMRNVFLAVFWIPLAIFLCTLALI